MRLVVNTFTALMVFCACAHSATLDFYVDSSVSMAGYYKRINDKGKVRLPDFLFLTTVYSEKLRTMYGYQTALFNFDTQLAPQKYGKDIFLQYTDAKGMYGQYTDYIIPLTRIAQSKTDVSVIISDMILDLGYGNSAMNRLKNALTAISKKKNAAASIVAVKGEFNGIVYTTTKDITTGKIKKIHTKGTIKRPIYYIIIGNSADVKKQTAIISSAAKDVNNQVKDFKIEVFNMCPPASKMRTRAVGYTSEELEYDKVTLENNDTDVLNIQCEKKSKKGAVRLAHNLKSGSLSENFSYIPTSTKAISIANDGTVSVDCAKIPNGQTRSITTRYTVRTTSRYYTKLKDYNTDNDLDEKQLDRTFGLFTVLKYFTSVFSSSVNHTLRIDASKE